jgi:hypothetical protein
MTPTDSLFCSGNQRTASPFVLEIVGEPRFCNGLGNAVCFYRVSLALAAFPSWQIEFDQLKICRDDRGKLWLSAPQLDPLRSWSGHWVNLVVFGPGLHKWLEARLLEDYRARRSQLALALG